MNNQIKLEIFIFSLMYWNIFLLVRNICIFFLTFPFSYIWNINVSLFFGQMYNTALTSLCFSNNMTKTQQETNVIW